MVKKTDDTLPDHIGWRLWAVSGVWQREFTAAMVAAGYDWYGDARAGVLPYVSLKGSRQSDIVAGMGLTKQAVQQLIVDLENSGILERVPDPDDGRGKIVRFTEAGLSAHRASTKVKRQIEDRFRKKLGKEDFDRLYDILKKAMDE